MHIVVVAAAAVLGLAMGSLAVEAVHRTEHGTLGPPLRRLRGGAGWPVAWYLSGRPFSDTYADRARSEVRIELLTALVVAAITARIGWDWSLPAYIVFATSLVALSVVDLREFRLPDRITFPTAAALVVLFGVAALGIDDLEPFRNAVIGGVAAFMFFFVFNLISPKGLAFGDVKLAGVMGIALGWLSLGHVLVGLFLGSFFGAVGGLVLLRIRGEGRRAHYPYGPFLAAGGLAAVWFGNLLVNGGSTV